MKANTAWRRNRKPSSDRLTGTTARKTTGYRLGLLTLFLRSSLLLACDDSSSARASLEVFDPAGATFRPAVALLPSSLIPSSTKDRLAGLSLTNKGQRT